MKYSFYGKGFLTISLLGQAINSGEIMLKKRWELGGEWASRGWKGKEVSCHFPTTGTLGQDVNCKRID